MNVGWSSKGLGGQGSEIEIALLHNTKPGFCSIEKFARKYSFGYRPLVYRYPYPTLLEAPVKTGVMWVGLNFRSIHLASLSAISSALASKSLVNFRSSLSLFGGGKSFASYSEMRRGSVSDVLKSGSKGVAKATAGEREGDISISTASTLGIGGQSRGKRTVGKQTGRRGNRNTGGTEPDNHGHSRAGQLR